MKDKRFNIPIATLSEGGHHYDFHLDRSFFEELEREEILDSDIDATVDINRRGDHYEILFRTEGEITVECHRCLDPLKLPVEAEYDIKVTYGEDYDDSKDGLLIIPDESRDLDVAPILADTVQLTIPMRAVHQECECNPEMEARISE